MRKVASLLPVLIVLAACDGDIPALIDNQTFFDVCVQDDEIRSGCFGKPVVLDMQKDSYSRWFVYDGKVMSDKYIIDLSLADLPRTDRTLATGWRHKFSGTLERCTTFFFFSCSTAYALLKNPRFADRDVTEEDHAHAARAAKKADTERAAWRECKFAGDQMSLTGGLSCGFPPRVVHSWAGGDVLYTSANCTNRNAFGVDMSVYLRCKTEHGITLIDHVE